MNKNMQVKKGRWILAAICSLLSCSLVASFRKTSAEELPIHSLNSECREMVAKTTLELKSAYHLGVGGIYVYQSMQRGAKLLDTGLELLITIDSTDGDKRMINDKSFWHANNFMSSAKLQQSLADRIGIPCPDLERITFAIHRSDDYNSFERSRSGRFSGKFSLLLGVKQEFEAICENLKISLYSDYNTPKNSKDSAFPYEYPAAIEINGEEHIGSLKGSTTMIFFTSRDGEIKLESTRSIHGNGRYIVTATVLEAGKREYECKRKDHRKIEINE